MTHLECGNFFWEIDFIRLACGQVYGGTFLTAIDTGNPVHYERGYPYVDGSGLLEKGIEQV